MNADDTAEEEWKDPWEDDWKETGYALTEEGLAELETLIGAPIPEDYGHFLRTIGGGIPVKRNFDFEGGRDSVIDGFYSYGTRQWPVGRGQAYVDFFEIPEDYVKIGSDIGGNPLLICVEEGEHFGAIYRKDHEDEEAEEGMHFVADSFTEFLDKLEADPPPEPLHIVEKLGLSGTPAEMEEFLKHHDGENTRIPDLDLNITQAAARFGNLEVLKLCIRKGLSLKEALPMAARGGKINVIDFLLENGYSSITERSEQGASKGWSLIGCAHVYPKVQDYLRKLGATNN